MCHCLWYAGTSHNGYFVLKNLFLFGLSKPKDNFLRNISYLRSRKIANSRFNVPIFSSQVCQNGLHMSVYV